MKRILIASLGCLLAFSSCKNGGKNNSGDAFAKADEEKNTVDTDYKFSLAQWSLHKPFQDGSLDPYEFPQIAKDLGFSGVEYVTQLYPKLNEAVGKPDYRDVVMTWAAEVNAKATEAGVRNVLIMVDHAGELADESAKKRAEAVANHKVWLDAAAAIGAHSVRANLFGIEDPEAWHEVSVQSLKELGTYGEKIGVSIVIENHGGNSSHGQRLTDVLKEVDMGSVGTLPDFGNFCVRRRDGDRWASPCTELYDMYKGTEELMPFATGVSAKSHEFNEDGTETDIDYPRMLQIVYDSGFRDGFIGVEYEGSLEDPKEGIALTKALLEKSIALLK